MTILSEISIKKFAVDNKLDKKPVKIDQNPEEVFVQKPVAEGDKEDSFQKYTKLFKDHSLFNEYGELMMMSPPVVNPRIPDFYLRFNYFNFILGIDGQKV